MLCGEELLAVTLCRICLRSVVQNELQLRCAKLLAEQIAISTSLEGKCEIFGQCNCDSKKRRGRRHPANGVSHSRQTYVIE